MGAEPYAYFVEYQPNVQLALDALREREFRAGRYFPVVLSPSFPPGARMPSPGAKHRSINEAREAAGLEGTRSILDITTIGEDPDFGVAAPVDDETLCDLYGTTHPTREMVEANMDFLVDVERGHCVYVVTYAGDDADGILFIGYTFD